MTDKQSRFVDEYCICLNAAEAARRAGYSQRSARSQGSENLTKPYIREAISERLNFQAMSSAEALARLTAIARFSLLEYISTDGTLNVERLMASRCQAVTGVRKTKHGPEFTFSDPLQALLHIAKAHGLFKERLDRKMEGCITVNFYPVQH